MEATKEKIIENSQKLEEIGKFHIKIFGELSDNVRSGGLEQKLDNMFKNLDEYENTMKQRFDEYDKIIKDLNEKATNASLSSSYKQQGDTISKTVRRWDIGFILSIIAIAAVAAWTFIGVNEILNKDISAVITELSQIKGGVNKTYNVSIIPSDKIYIMLFGFFSKITMALPFIWLAIFCSNRRKEAMRLEQEYAHKVAVASSYASYKEQISNLNETNPELLKELMASTINIISKNPSDFLDKSKNSDKLIDCDGIITKMKQLPEWLINLIKQKNKN